MPSWIPKSGSRSRVGVVLGTTSGEALVVQQYNDFRKASGLVSIPDDVPGLYPSHVIPGHIADEFGVLGPCLTIPTACAAGNYAIGYGFDLVRAGRLDVALAGGADPFTRITYSGFARLGAIAPERCQPFDRNRKGMIPGEGAAIVVLEPLDRAIARRAPIYAEILGYGLTCDAHHMTAGHPLGDGAARAMRAALAMSGVGTESVDYVSAHGTGTPTNDRVESTGPPIRVWRSCRAASHEFDQVDDRPHDGRSERDRGGGLRAGTLDRRCSANDEFRIAGPGVSGRLCAEPGPGTASARGVEQRLRVRGQQLVPLHGSVRARVAHLMSERVVITGAGVVSALGVGTAEFARALFEGVCAGARSSRFEEGYVTAEIADFNPEPWLGTGIRVLDRTARLLCVATQLAMNDAGLDARAEGTDAELGLVCGTMLGGIHSIASFDWNGITDGPQYVSPLAFPNTVINSAAGQAAIRFALRGINSTLCAGLASGAFALGYAADFVRLGRVRRVMAGGVEELSEEVLVGLQKSGALSATGVARPFARARDGCVPGEGAAILALESESDARARGMAPGIALAGFGATRDVAGREAGDATAPGGAEAIRLALEEADIGPEHVACIVSGGSGNRLGDAREASALRAVFGGRLADVPACAPKAAFGECLGGAGAMSALVASAALSGQRLPPTPGSLGFGEYGIRLSPVTQEVHGDYALVNISGCDGNNAALVLHRFAAGR